MHLLLSLLLLINNALAQDNLQRASDLYKNGQLLFEEGNYTSALIAWQEAYDLTGNAAMLKHIARAQEAQGDYNSAIETVSTYRALAPFEEQQALIEWTTSLLERQRKAEQDARERAEQTRIAEDRKKREEQQNLLKEERQKLDEGFKQLNDEQQKVSLQQEQQKTMIPMLVSWTALTALSTTTFIFHSKAEDAYYTSITDYCVPQNSERNQMCRQPISLEEQQSLSTALENYNTQRGVSLVAWGLTAVSIGATAWTTYRYISKKKTSRSATTESK